MRWHAAAAALLTILVASLALNAYQYSSPRSVTVTTTEVATGPKGAQNAVTYHSPNATIPIASAESIPNFIVGNYLFNATSEGPPLASNSHNGSTLTITYLDGARITFTVTTTQIVPSVSQKVNFTWAGTFCGCTPGPVNATLFNGAVRMNWFVNSSLSYVHITTKWPPII
jgi:hypothetical protein